MSGPTDITRKTEVAERVRSWIVQQPVYLDTETTGVKSNAEAVQFTLVDDAGGLAYNQIVRPTVPIPADATAIHGISETMVSGAPKFTDLWPTIHEALAGRLVVIYNAQYDLRVMAQSLSAHGVKLAVTPWKDAVCAMLAYSQFDGTPGKYGGFKWWKLSEACQRLGIDTSDVALHDARGDCELTRRLVHKMAEYTP